MMIIISAMTRGTHYIGQGDGMPWDIPDEYRQFLDFIRDQTIIMGRRSYDIFGQDLTSAHNIVISRSAEAMSGATVCSSLEEAIGTAESFGETVFIGGGASIYSQTLPLAERMYISYIKGEYTGDMQFPDFDPGDWVVEEREDHSEFEFVRYRRKKKEEGF